jgi:hypothetical protein
MSSLRRANSFAPVARDDAGSSPFKRAATSAAVLAVHGPQAGSSSTSVIAPPG